MVDYLPQTDGGLAQWAGNFAALISADPGRFGVTAQDAQAIAQAVQAYLSAYTTAVEPITRTKVKVLVKNKARKAMVAVVRRYAGLIKANPAVSGPSKADLGLGRERLGQGRTRVSAPSTRPMLSLYDIQPHCHVLRYLDTGDTDGNNRGGGKPAGVLGLQLFCHVGDTPPMDPQDARFERFVTRQPVRVEFKPEQVGKRVHYFARWQNAKGETGPWSLPTTAVVWG